MSKLKEMNAWIKATGRKLGVYEGVLKSIHTLHPYTPAFQLMRNDYPDLYKEVASGSAVDSAEA
jgi:hypothetical protein